MYRVPVISKNGKPLMPTKSSRARRWLQEGKAVIYKNDLQGDYVEAERKGVKYRGWVSGDTKTQVSVSNFDWKRIAQFSAKKTKLLKRNTNLIVKTLNGGRAFLSR